MDIVKRVESRENIILNWREVLILEMHYLILMVIKYKLIFSAEGK